MRGLNIKQLIPWKQVGFLAAGFAATAVLIALFGAAAVGRGLAAVGPSLLILLGVTFFWHFLQALGWQVVLSRPGVSFWGLFKISLGGYALDALSPFALIGGNSYRMARLRKDQKVEDPSSSLIADQAVRSLVLLALCRWLPLQKISPATKGKIEEMNRHLRNFYRERKGDFYQALLVHFLAAGLSVTEIYVIGRSLQPDFRPLFALLLAAVSPLVRLLFSFLPGAFGALEGVFTFLASVFLGQPAAAVGLVIALVRRLRALFWIIVGLVFTGNPFKMFLGK
jgi:uncharacterized membrane protein YbhN (UPF0104 family)